MFVLHEVTSQVFYILTDKLTMKAAKGHVAPQMSLHLILCGEYDFAGLVGAGNKSETMCGHQVGLIFLTLCAAELAALLGAGKQAHFRFTSTVDAFKVAFQDTRLEKSLVA